ncbi:MAG: hypothetical protein ABJC07_10795 [Acidobacteriota bacterium]
MPKWNAGAALAWALAVFAGAARPGISVETRPAHVPVSAVAALPSDVATIDGIVKAYYEVISGPAGRPRQWARDRTLYIPDVRFVSVGEGPGGRPVPRVMTHQEYVDSTDGSFVSKGFDEREVHRTELRFGEIASVFSTYESRLSAGGRVTDRGINSLQLFFDGTRWWIVSATWRDESPSRRIPDEYLTSGSR